MRAVRRGTKETRQNMSDCVNHPPLCDFCDNEPSVVEADGVSLTKPGRTRHVVNIGERCIRALALRARLTVADNVGGSQIELSKLADAVREVRRDLTKAAHQESLPGWSCPRICVCGLDAQRCDTTCDPNAPRCGGPSLRHAIRRLSDALL